LTAFARHSRESRNPDLDLRLKTVPVATGCLSARHSRKSGNPEFDLDLRLPTFSIFKPLIHCKLKLTIVKLPLSSSETA